jgi:hypothetical protein
MKRNTPSRIAPVRDVKKFRIDDLRFEQFTGPEPECQRYSVCLTSQEALAFVDLTTSDPRVVRGCARNLYRLARRLAELRAA